MGAPWEEGMYVHVCMCAHVFVRTCEHVGACVCEIVLHTLPSRPWFIKHARYTHTLFSQLPPEVGK